MKARGQLNTAKLCGAVDPSVRQDTAYTAELHGMLFDLRLVYIAEDDLGFINQCTHQWDEFSSNMHREPYHSVALSNSGQTFIISMNQEPICVVEVHHALQYYLGDEFMPRANDYIVRLFFAGTLALNVQTGMVHFFANYCSRFHEVGGLIIKAEAVDANALLQAGFSAQKNADGGNTGYYYYSTSKENV